MRIKGLPGKGRVALFSLGLTGAAIAHAAGVHPSYVSRCLNGRVRPSARLIEAAEEATGLPAEMLFEMREASGAAQ